MRAGDVYGLAKARFERYTVSSQPDDLEQSILGFTEAILYPPLSRDASTPSLNIAQIFYHLTLAIFIRANESKRPEDVKWCIMYLRYLCGQLHEVHDHFSFPVAGVLIRTLAVQVEIATSPSSNSTLELELGDVGQNIEEMANLCDELLDSDISTDTLTEPIMAFVRALHHAGLKEAFRTQIPSEKALGCLRKAVIRLPDLHFISIVLADSLFNHLFLTLSDDDYKRGWPSWTNLSVSPALEISQVDTGKWL